MHKRILDELRRDEGLRLESYQDVNDIWTIGYGTNLQVLTISEDTAERWLRKEYDKAVEDSEAITEYQWLSKVRKAVIVMLVYQLGKAGLMKFKRFWDGVRTHDWQAAHDELLDSKMAREDSPLRARRHAKRFLADSW